MFCFDVQDSNGLSYTVLVDLVKCGLSDTKTCLRTVTLALGSNSVVSCRHENIIITLSEKNPDLTKFCAFSHQ